MPNFTKRLREVVENATFCYAKEGGQGFVKKEECTCFGSHPCQATQDRERFQKRFEELGYGHGEVNLQKRNEIIAIIKPEFADSEWWKNNVKE